jgi:hypothetical protein
VNNCLSFYLRILITPVVSLNFPSKCHTILKDNFQNQNIIQRIGKKFKSDNGVLLDCCLTLSKQYFSKIIDENSFQTINLISVKGGNVVSLMVEVYSLATGYTRPLLTKFIGG